MPWYMDVDIDGVVLILGPEHPQKDLPIFVQVLFVPFVALVLIEYMCVSLYLEFLST